MRERGAGKPTPSVIQLISVTDSIVSPLSSSAVNNNVDAWRRDSRRVERVDILYRDVPVRQASYDWGAPSSCDMRG